jgi:hypothetical protein
MMFGPVGTANALNAQLNAWAEKKKMMITIMTQVVLKV